MRQWIYTHGIRRRCRRSTGRITRQRKRRNRLRLKVHDGECVVRTVDDRREMQNVVHANSRGRISHRERGARGVSGEIYESYGTRASAGSVIHNHSGAERGIDRDGCWLGADRDRRKRRGGNVRRRRRDGNVD